MAYIHVHTICVAIVACIEELGLLGKALGMWLGLDLGDAFCVRTQMAEPTQGS
jgi:hypothetical protein